MAKGLKCRECGHSMAATKEEDQPKGRWVLYTCPSCGWSEKKFEEYADKS